MDKRKALKWFIGILAAELFTVALMVFLFDPFYQYHEPWFGLKAVLNDRDNQVPGTIRNFSYDSVILGSSVAENFDSAYLDNRYDCSTLKIIRASGSVADLMYYMDMAHQHQELTHVFWSMDISSLTCSTEVTLYSGGTPRYLHTATILDDIPYLFNKEVLLEKIPHMIACSFAGINTDGHAYDWSKDKNFSTGQALLAYHAPETAAASVLTQEDRALVEENLEMVYQEITSHPETTYKVFFPPFSKLWWKLRYWDGSVEKYFYALEHVLPMLLDLDNVEVFYFMSDETIVGDLNNYMDIVHYSPAINQYLLESLETDAYRVTADNWSDYLDATVLMYEKYAEEAQTEKAQTEEAPSS